jgi:hypothetical protein
MLGLALVLSSVSKMASVWKCGSHEEPITARVGILLERESFFQDGGCDWVEVHEQRMKSGSQAEAALSLVFSTFQESGPSIMGGQDLKGRERLLSLIPSSILLHKLWVLCITEGPCRDP